MFYSTILVDPPWKVKRGPASLHKKNQPSRDLTYATMSVKEIAQLQLPAARDCHLYLWTINKYLEDSYAIARAWGFKPSTMLVWAKPPMGRSLGGTYGISIEYLLFCRKGALRANGREWRNWWEIPRKSGHSTKPEFFHQLIEKHSPGPHLELFARKPRLGWTCIGNEITGNDVRVDLERLTQ